MSVLMIIIIIDILIVVGVMYWGSKEDLEDGHPTAADSKAVAALIAKQPKPATETNTPAEATPTEATDS